MKKFERFMIKTILALAWMSLMFIHLPMWILNIWIAISCFAFSTCLYNYILNITNTGEDISDES